MATPTPTAPNSTPPLQTLPSVSATIIAEVGNGVTRLASVAVPLAITVADAVAEYLPHVRTSLEGMAAPAQRGELATATSELISTGARLTLDLLRVSVRGLDAMSRAVSAEATESGAPPRP